MKTVNGVEVVEDALVLEEAEMKTSSGPRKYVIWAVRWPGGWHGEPAMLVQVAFATEGTRPPGGLILTKGMIEKLLAAVQ